MEFLILFSQVAGTIAAAIFVVFLLGLLVDRICDKFGYVAAGAFFFLFMTLLLTSIIYADAHSQDSTDCRAKIAKGGG